MENRKDQNNFEETLRLNAEFINLAAKSWNKSKHKYFIITYAMDNEENRKTAVQLNGANINKLDLYNIMMSINSALVDLHDNGLSGSDAVGGVEEPQGMLPPTTPTPSITEF